VTKYSQNKGCSSFANSNIIMGRQRRIQSLMSITSDSQGLILLYNCRFPEKHIFLS